MLVLWFLDVVLRFEQRNDRPGCRHLVSQLAASQHLAALVRVSQVSTRLQPVASSSFDHRAEEVREGLFGFLAAVLRGKRDDRVADRLE